MAVLAKDDQGVGAGVCHDGIDLRDSVDDGETNPSEDWRMLVAFPGRSLQSFSHVRIWPGRIWLHWLQVTSIDLNL